ncbi:hypothetical protein B0T26DRAFT_4524 [Lasiosphaeria miniovina]|uniref:Uncharacterized protein n=1 Tax=Lasiosphaeria miniovina TaxID=1954250 RepID=A0AA40BF60_9PEZI|nr:uncharacterized protein B0T26DRAFT_4524 [Lasiosphaeria miniovina]KAK0733075.1 hypothetical protein B0T26DRAFT_4524 [Lasiosphaeria miniovina]
MGSNESSTSSSKASRNETSRALIDIFGQIQALYSLGILLRRPGVSRRYLKSGKQAFHGGPSPSSPEDLSHVRECIRRWRSDQSGIGVPPEEERVASWEEIIRRNERAADLDSEEPDARLMQRLSLANALRREQLIYWRDHPDQVIFTEPTAPAQPFPASQGPIVDGESVKSGTVSLFSKNTVAKSDILGVASSLQGP